MSLAFWSVLGLGGRCVLLLVVFELADHLGGRFPMVVCIILCKGWKEEKGGVGVVRFDRSTASS